MLAGMAVLNCTPHLTENSEKGGGHPWEPRIGSSALRGAIATLSWEIFAMQDIAQWFFEARVLLEKYEIQIYM